MSGLAIAQVVQPDVEAFMGGLEAAVISGFVLIVAMVIVMAIRRLFQGL